VVPLRDIVAKIMELREYPLRLQNVHLEFRDSDPPAAVETNVEQAVQILLNLVSNAEQAVEPVMAARSGSHGFISLRAERFGEGIRLRIQDSGGGIPEETAKLIFQPFFSTRGVGEGTGLGLAVGQTLMEAHGGKLYLESSDSSGSCFVMEFPQALPLPALAPDEAPVEMPIAKLPVDLPVDVSAPPPVAPSTAAKLGRVLVVDDEPAILEFLNRFLNILRIEVVTASNGLEGLQMLEQGKFHVVLSDIKMPELDGIGFYERAVASHPEYRKRFVFMSGDLQTQSLQEFHKKTGCRILEKPFTTAQLRDALFSYFEAAAPASPVQAFA
jgi:CheY-like chemotaxis protein